MATKIPMAQGAQKVSKKLATENHRETEEKKEKGGRPLGLR
jgi:hypothetical protein